MSQAVDRAFRAIQRKHFLPDDQVENARLDMPLPIGYGQTNSQPTTVAMMLDWLAVESGDVVLDVGSGSGWTSALLAYLSGPTGRVIAVEVVPELVEFGRQNCEKLAIKNVEFHRAHGGYGWPSKAPYDRILVSAAGDEVPEDLIEQLAKGGRLIIPVGSSIWVIDKDEAGNIASRQFPGFTFVPLVGG